MAIPPVRAPGPKLLVVGSAGHCALFGRLRPGCVTATDAVAFAEAFSAGGFTHAVVAMGAAWVDGGALLAALRRRFPDVALYALGDVSTPGVLRAALDARVADVVADTLDGVVALADRLPGGEARGTEGEAELARLRDRVALLEAERASGGASGARFAAEVAHDLREPLRSSKLLLERVEGALARGDGEGAVALVARLYEASARLEEQVDSALNAVAGREEPPSLTSVDAVLDEALEQLAQLLEETGGTVERSALPFVALPAAQLRQLFQNLVANALRYGGSPPRVEVSARRDGDLWVLRVRDHGPGIPVAEREAIFRPLTRLVGKEAPHGHGLGLAICRKLVTRAGGTIAVEDAPGGGTCFVVRLPAAADEPTERLAR